MNMIRARARISLTISESGTVAHVHVQLPNNVGNTWFVLGIPQGIERAELYDRARASARVVVGPGVDIVDIEVDSGALGTLSVRPGGPDAVKGVPT